jgi:hypothetical protein
MIIEVLALVLAGAQPAGSAAGTAQVTGPRLELARRIAADPGILEAVAARNRSPESQDAIAKSDQEWQRNKDFPMRRELTSNACATQLRKLVAPDPAVVEAFVMDARGSLVCSTVETSDYWQGDEAKWQRTYAQGRESFVDEPALDANTGTYAIQLSALVSDKGRKQGALTLTLKVPRQQMNP